jgi:hypothetical protein
MYPDNIYGFRICSDLPFYCGSILRSCPLLDIFFMTRSTQFQRMIRQVIDCILCLGIGLFAVSCASPNVNPKGPRSKSGYIDFYSKPDADLFWEVERFDSSANAYKTAFSEMKPVKDEFLRLGFAPGTYQLRLTVLNLAVVEPAIVQVEVKEGFVTPVLVELAQVGQSAVVSKETRVGSNLYGRYGRRTKIINSQTGGIYRATASAQPFQPYQPKQQMSYFKKPEG